MQIATSGSSCYHCQRWWNKGKHLGTWRQDPGKLKLRPLRPLGRKARCLVLRVWAQRRGLNGIQTSEGETMAGWCLGRQSLIKLLFQVLDKTANCIQMLPGKGSVAAKVMKHCRARCTEAKSSLEDPWRWRAGASFPFLPQLWSLRCP